MSLPAIFSSKALSPLSALFVLNTGPTLSVPLWTGWRGRWYYTQPVPPACKSYFTVTGLFIASLLNFFFIFFIILFFCFIFLYPTSPHDMQVIFHCHLNLFITTPTLFNIGHRHKSQVSIDDGKWKNNEISLHLQSISAWLRFCTRNWHSDSSVLLEIWQNVSRTECKKTQPKICSGFSWGVVKTKPKTGWSIKDVHPEWYLYYLLRLTCRSIKCEGKREVIMLSGHHGPKPTPTQPLSRHDRPQYSYSENIILPKIKMCLMVPQPNPTKTSQPTRPFTTILLSNKQRT